MEQRREEEARRDSEGVARREGMKQAQEWISKRVEDLGKKKVAVRAALNVVLPEVGKEELK